MFCATVCLGLGLTLKEHGEQQPEVQVLQQGVLPTAILVLAVSV